MTAAAGVLVSVTLALAQSVPPAHCNAFDGRDTSWAIHAENFEDHSPATWSLSVDAEGRMEVQSVDEGVRHLQIGKAEIRHLAARISAPEVWSWPSMRGAPSNLGHLELEICSAGRKHRITHFGLTNSQDVRDMDIEFIGIMVRLRKLFTSKRAGTLDGAEAYLNDPRKKAQVR